MPKRLLAYSGIAQVGYIVAAFAGQTPQGLRYAIFYLAAYTFMNLGAFAVVDKTRRDFGFQRDVAYGRAEKFSFRTATATTLTSRMRPEIEYHIR